MFKILAIESEKELFDFIKKRYHLSLSFSHLPKLNLYNFIEYFINEFSVKEKETDFILNFLEMLYAFTQHNGVTLKDFLKFWEEEGKDTSIQASENVDAIQIMTIHKAKGLEFPVVFLPMENKNEDGKFTEWYNLVDEHHGLNSVNISGFGKEFETYDEDIMKFNHENTYKNIIDRICVQYVATTRPVEQLFLYLEKPNNSTNHLEILDFVNQFNHHNTDNFDLYPISENELKKQSKKQKNNHQTMAVHTLQNNQKNTNNIKIATPSKNYQNRNQKVRLGILIHDIFAQIAHQNDVEKVLENQLIQGNITQEEKDAISKMILKIINHPKYSHFFSEEVQEVLNEREILITEENGEQSIYRPDRIIKNHEGYIIIDFKTGKEKEKEHQKQIQTYQKALEKLGKKVVGTEIIYID